MCKQRAVSVCPTSAELRTCAQLFSLCCQWPSPGWAHPRGLHWEACTQSDIWTAQEAIIPILGFFFSLLTASLSVSLHLFLSLELPICLPPSFFPLLPRRGPQVIVTRERMMNSSTTEPADSLALAAAAASPFSGLPFLFLSPRIPRVHLSPRWQHY